MPLKEHIQRSTQQIIMSYFEIIVKPGYNEQLGTGHFRSLYPGYVIIGLICVVNCQICPKNLFVITECSLTTEFVKTEFQCTFFIEEIYVFEIVSQLYELIVVSFICIRVLIQFIITTAQKTMLIEEKQERVPLFQCCRPTDNLFTLSNSLSLFI